MLMIIKLNRIMSGLKTLYYIIFFCISLVGRSQIYQIPIDGPFSLVRVGMNPHPTESKDTLLAYTLMSALDRYDIDSLIFVADAFRKKKDSGNMNEKSWGALSYITDRIIKEYSGEHQQEDNLLTEDLFHFFTDNDYEHLKNYLVIKYELNNYRPQSVKEHIDQRTFYDDFLMFNDPNREEWDHTANIMKLLPVKKGDKVVDVGAGFGYNSCQLMNLVGEGGLVYATDTQSSCVEYLENFVNKNKIRNIKPILTHSNQLGVEDKVDCVIMSSLYHIIYTWSREDERTPFINSIIQHLNENGFIVIIDNYNLSGDELNNCHIDPRLIQAQLGFWGFEPISLTSLNTQRYMLIMRKNEKYSPNVKVKTEKGIPVLDIIEKKSVVHIGSLDSYDITDKGIDAATYVYDYVSSGDKSLAEIAIQKYNEIIPSENFGGEYSALQWICEVKTSPAENQYSMLDNPLTRSFYHTMTDDSCRVLRYYLLHKYKLGNDSIRMATDSLLEMSGEVGRTHRSFLEDYILALNPRRPQWENTSEIVNNIGLKEGEMIADVGCGSGFFTYKFSGMVGNRGKVYGVEIKDEHINMLKTFIDQENIKNIIVLKGKEDVLDLPEEVDKIFMCSLYHIMYGVISDNKRDAYLKSLVKCLKRNGELIIVDNGPVDDDTLPYHGPFISKELIVYQLKFYGFELKDYVQIIPQRYMLKFKLKK